MSKVFKGKSTAKNSIVDTALSWVSKPLQTRLKITRRLQEFGQEVGMALFISTQHENEDLQRYYVKLFDKWIKAHLAYVGLNLIYGIAFEEIRNTHFLDAYFKQFKSYNILCSISDQDRKQMQKTETDESLFSTLCQAFSVESLTGAIEALIQTPFEVLKAAANLIASYLEIDNVAPEQLIDFINQHFQLEPPDLVNNIPSPELAQIINPFIWLDWAIIKTEIALFWAYIIVFTNLAEEYPPRPYLQWGDSKLYMTAVMPDLKVTELKKYILQPLKDDLFFTLDKSFFEQYTDATEFCFKFVHEGVESNELCITPTAPLQLTWECNRGGYGLTVETEGTCPDTHDNNLSTRYRIYHTNVLGEGTESWVYSIVKANRITKFTINPWVGVYPGFAGTARLYTLDENYNETLEKEAVISTDKEPVFQGTYEAWGLKLEVIQDHPYTSQAIIWDWQLQAE